MTTATFYRNHKGQVTRFSIVDHANFADYGEDIVCASISYLTISIINGIEEVVGQKLIYSIDEVKGIVRCKIPKGIEEEVMKMTQILLETLVINIKQLTNDYPGNVKVYEEEV